MKELDTNIPDSFLTGDGRIQTKKACNILKKHEQETTNCLSHYSSHWNLFGCWNQSIKYQDLKFENQIILQQFVEKAGNQDRCPTKANTRQVCQMTAFNAKNPTARVSLKTGYHLSL